MIEPTKTNEKPIHSNIHLSGLEFTFIKHKSHSYSSNDKGFNSTCIKSNNSDFNTNLKSSYEKEYEYASNVYVRPFCQYDEEDYFTANKELFKADDLAENIKKCSIHKLLSKKRASDECLNQVSTFNERLSFVENEEKESFMKDFDKLSIDISPTKEKINKKAQKQKDIKREVIINKTDFSIFEKAYKSTL